MICAVVYCVPFWKPLKCISRMIGPCERKQREEIKQGFRDAAILEGHRNSSPQMNGGLCSFQENTTLGLSYKPAGHRYNKSCHSLDIYVGRINGLLTVLMNVLYSERAKLM